MFSSNMKEASADVVCLQDTDLEAFSILVQFMQTSVLGITADNICKVTETASMYQVCVIYTSSEISVVSVMNNTVFTFC